MKKIILLLLLLLFVVFMGTEANSPDKPLKNTIIPFPDILKPGMINVRYDRLFVTENATVSIYSLKDFKLIKKFGKPGEGPQEFKVNPYGGQLILEVFPEYILVNSMGRLSYFTLNGDFIKEKNNAPGFYIQPMGKHFVGASETVGEENTRFRTINLYDPDFKKLCEIHRQEHEIQVQKGKGIHLLKQAFTYYVVGDKIFVSGREGFVIDIYDEKGKLLHTIEEKDYKRRKVTDADRKGIHRLLKRQFKELYELYKNTITIAPTFPAIGSIFVRDQRVYVLTNKEKDEMFETFIFDLDGKLIKKIFIPLTKKNTLQAYPTDIRDGKIYQLIENEEDEVWELHIIQFE